MKEQLKIEILNIINYHLSISKILVNIDEDLIQEYYCYKNVGNMGWSPRHKEILYSILSFYSHIYVNIEEDFIKIYTAILENKDIVNEKDTLYSIVSKHFQSDPNQSALFLSIIIYKGLTKLSLNSNILIDYKNSDDVLNESVANIYNFIIYFNLKFMSKKEIRTSFFRLYIYLVLKKIINEKKTNIETDELYDKTLRFWSCQKSTYYINSSEYLNYSYHRLKLVKYNNTSYLVGGYFTKVTELYRKNWHSGESFILLDQKIINILLDNGVYVDKENFDQINRIIQNHESIVFENLSVELRADLEKITKYDYAGRMSKKRVAELIETQKSFSKKFNYYMLHLFYREIINENEKIYFPFYFDFRGRLYYDSPVSITNSRIARFLFFYGWYESLEHDMDYDERILQLIEDKSKTLVKILQELHIEVNAYTVDIMFWILISIGKIFINKSEVTINIDTFIEHGHQYLTQKKDSKLIDNFKLEDKIELFHYSSIIKSIKIGGKVKKRVVLKDATASVIQNLIRLLGPLNQDSLKIANMGDVSNWWDPYSFLLKKFLENLDKEMVKSDCLKHFSRKTIKKTIMTVPYSAKESTCFDYFIAELNCKFEKKDYDELKALFKLFYRFIKTEAEKKYLLKNSSNTLVDFALKEVKKNKNFVIHDESSYTSLIYFKHKHSYIDILIKVPKDFLDTSNNKTMNKLTQRFTKKVLIVNQEKINKNKIKSSVKANWIHFMDANLLRLIIKELNSYTMTVHDCFLIDFVNVGNLINKSNYIMSQRVFTPGNWDNSFEYEMLSIFILL